MSRFFGREHELAGVPGLLDRTRLVTLSGTAGIGKSRLAFELADREPGRTRFVDLATTDDAGLPALVRDAAARLDNGRGLLVLDNCEHVVGGCAEVVPALLDGARGLRVLATSRERLGLAQELVVLVPPLAPDDAAGLFAERAAAAQPRFALNGYVGPTVAEICGRLEGNPLAIELAAARVGLLTPAEILARLDARFGLLIGRCGRHASLEAALDWGDALLSASERTLLRRLSVFAGGFDLQAATAVCAGGAVEPGDVPGVLERLAAKSLVAADPPARHRLPETIRAHAGMRLERAGESPAVREAHARWYLGLAETAEPELTGPRQEEWLERLAVEQGNLRAAIEWSLGQGRPAWGLRLTGALVLFWRVRCHFGEGRELLEAALRAGGPAAEGLETKALWGAGFLAHMAGDSDRAVAPLGESLARATAEGDLQGRARALLILGNCMQSRDRDTALAMLADSVALARAADDRWCLAHALGIAGFERWRRDELVEATRLLEECLDVARAAEDKQSLRVALVGLGVVSTSRGDYETAEPLLLEAAHVAGELGDDYTRGTALQNLGHVALGRGQYTRARELLDGSLALVRASRPADLVVPLVARAQVSRVLGERADARRLVDEALRVARGGPNSPTPAVHALAELAADEGRRGAARRLFGEALDGARAEGDGAGAAGALHGLGELARAEGNVKRAVLLHREALVLHHEQGRRQGVVVCLEALGRLAVQAGRGRQGARLLGAATALREAYGYVRHPGEAEQHLASVELLGGLLRGHELEAASAAGAALSLDDAVAEALKGRADAGAQARDWSCLTESERQLAALVAEGLTNREIAGVLYISLGTVKSHLSRIFEKLGISRRRELAWEASRRGERGFR
ncbi:MAG TPA: tetratricopeptide repeat protein [Solirubrobacteraceae bacterium]|nr:tetratricopeptide repeat protein [Solirubrobacteraceae bacterium]